MNVYGAGGGAALLRTGQEGVISLLEDLEFLLSRLR